MYEYKVLEIKKIYDGDTITVVIDLGFDTRRVESLRLAGIDAPEIRGEERAEGLIARDWLINRLYTALEIGRDIIIRTDKDSTGKYGRYIAEVFIDEVSINEELVEKGLADLKARPEYFEQFNSPNGWGMYENFVPFVSEYLEALKEYPEAKIQVCR